MREHGVPQFTVDTHRAGRRLRPARGLVLDRARLHEPAHRARPRGHPAARGGPRRGRPAGHRRRPRGVQPRADRRLHRRGRDRRRRAGRARRSPTSSRDWKAAGPSGRPRRAAAPAGPHRWRLRAARSTTSTTCPTAGSSGSPPNRRRRAVAGLEAHRHGPRRVAVPEAAAGAAGRDRARADVGRDLPRLHARLPVLPGRHDHATGSRALDHRHRRDGRKRSWRQPASRRSACCRCRQRRPLRDRRRSPRAWPTATRARNRAVAAVDPGRRVQHRPGQRADPQRPALRADVRAGGRVRADAQGDQQDGHRGGPDPRPSPPRTATAGGR